MLLTGTWYELLFKIKQTLDDADKIIYFINMVRENEPSPEIVDEVKNFLLAQDSKAVFAPSEDLNADLVRLSISLATALSEYEQPFLRLATLLKKPNHIHPNQLVPRRQKLKLDFDLLTSFQQALDKLRPRGIEHSNYADAANLAGIVAIRRFMNKNQHRLPTSRLARVFLLSHSPTLVNIDNWAEDKLGEIGENLTRTPTDVLYHMLVEDKSPQKTRESVKYRLSLCDAAGEYIRDTVHELISIEEREPGKLQEITNLWPLEGNLRLDVKETQTSSPSINRFLRYVRDPVIFQATCILQQNRVLSENKALGPYEDDDSDPAVDLGELAHQTEMRILSLWQDVQSRFSIELEDIGMQIKEQTLENGEHRLLIVTEIQDSVVFGLECYDGYYSAFWPTDLLFEEYLTKVRLSLSELAKSTHPVPPKKDAILVFITDQRMDMTKINVGEITPENLLEVVTLKDQEVLRFIRIATAWGDFCYDIQPVTLHEPLYAGFVGKHQLVDSLAEMFFRMSVHESLIPRLLKKHIAAKLKVYPNWGV
jgi:hypothetical protein